MVSIVANKIACLQLYRNICYIIVKPSLSQFKTHCKDNTGYIPQPKKQS